MPGAGTVILRRGLVLLFSFVLIIIIVSAIIEGTGYSENIYKAIISEIVRGEIEAFRQHGGVNVAKAMVDWLQNYISKPESKGIVDKPLMDRIQNVISKAQEDISKVDVGELYSIYKEIRSRELKIEMGLAEIRDGEYVLVPAYRRMWIMVTKCLTLDFGETDKVGVTNVVPRDAPAKVIDVIAAVLPRTILVVTTAEVLLIVIALLVGPRIVYRYGTFLDKFVVAYAAAMTAIPIWWLAMVFLSIFSYRLGLFPTDLRGVVGVLNNFWRNPAYNFLILLWYISLPLIVILITGLGGWLYGMRAMLLRVVREDYVTAAKARGLPERLITRRYILKPSLAPVLTNVILALAGSLGGMIITESVFNWPGMGTLYYAAITEGDSSTIAALSTIYIGIYMIARFILEVLYIIVDPRIRAK